MVEVDPRLQGRRVLVLGVSPEVNRGVTEPLRDFGVAAQGWTKPDRATRTFDANDFDLIAFGRATAGPVADQIKGVFRAQNPDVLLLDVIGPFAVRQIVAALRHDPRSPRLLRNLRVAPASRGAIIRVQLLAPCHLTLTLFTKGPEAMESKTLAECDARFGEREWTVDAASLPGAYSLVLAANDEEFLHHPFVRGRDRPVAGVDPSEFEDDSGRSNPPAKISDRSL